MIVVAGFLLALISVPLFGGKFRRLSELSFDSGWLVVAAMLIQIPITTFATGWLPATLLALIHVGTYLFAFAFVWINRKMIGIVLLVLGAGCNFLAIAANGGVMPASQRALDVAGLATDGDFQNSGYVEDAKLAFLGDIFAVPEQWPLSNVFSIGDLLLVAGAGYMLHRFSGSILFMNARRDYYVAEFWLRVEKEDQRWNEARLLEERAREVLEA